MVAIDLKYEGDLHCSAVHGPSGATLATDAPIDNQGLGESFSPTDLVATALASCMMTIMGIVARNHNLDITGTKAHVTKEMATQPVRRIARLAVTIEVPQPVSEENRRRFEHAVFTCPVHKSLHPDIEMPVEFVWHD